MEPVSKDLKIYAGDDYTCMFTFKNGAGDPLNVSDFVFRAQIRSYPQASTVMAEFDVDGSSSATGVIVLRLGKTVTRVLKDGVWDFQRTDSSGNVRTLVAGKITVEPEVTRE